jgi:hypothetical protein
VASPRSTPLTHSFCQYVVTSAEPLIVPDAREHPLLRDNRGVHDLGVVAYAGMPLTDETGDVLGSLCAIDIRPRQWTDDELTALRDLADACSTELRLRLVRYEAQVERARRDQLEEAAPLGRAARSCAPGGLTTRRRSTTCAPGRGELVASELARRTRCWWAGPPPLSRRTSHDHHARRLRRGPWTGAAPAVPDRVAHQRAGHAHQLPEVPG